MLRTIEVEQWDRGFVRFHGSWVEDNGKELNSGEPITLECYRGDQCLEVRVPVGGGAAFIDYHWGIITWSGDEIVLRPMPVACGELSIRISRFPAAVRETLKASTNAGACEGQVEEHRLLRVR